jgi:hypothetical protein
MSTATWNCWQVTEVGGAAGELEHLFQQFPAEHLRLAQSGVLIHHPAAADRPTLSRI